MSEAIEDTGSLSEHEAAHYPNPARAAESVEAPAPVVAEPEGNPTKPEETEETPQQKEARARDESGKFTKHRPKSQEASKEDVPRIKELTKRLREAEERAAEYERRASERVPEPRRAPEPAVRPVSAEFTEKEPIIEQFEKEADPYAAWIRAVNRYDRKKEAFESEQQRVVAEREKVEADGAAYVDNLRRQYAEREAAFDAEHPDFRELRQSKFASWTVPPVGHAVILEHQRSAEIVYNLLKNPVELAGFISFVKPFTEVNEENVAIATHWLENRALDAQTGSPVPVVPRKPTPTPPNPVRTVPSGGSDSDDDVESMPLSSFERKFHKGRR